MTDEDSTESRADLLLRRGRIITMDPERRILVDGAVAIGAGRILDVGPDREVSAMTRAAATRDLGGALVNPGLVDAHVHAGSSELSRGLAPKDHADYEAVDDWLFTYRRPETDHLGALLSCMEMVTNGTTAYSDTGGSFFLEETVRAIETVGMRGMPGHSMLDFNPQVPGRDTSAGAMSDEEAETLRTPTWECVEKLEEQMSRYPFHDGGRVRGGATMYGCMRCSDQLLIEAQALAREHGAPMIMHQSWDPEEVTISEALYGCRPIEHLAEIGVLDGNLTLVHMNHLSPTEVDLVAESGTRVVHCPAASLRRGMGAIRNGSFPEMLAKGVPVALGSDGYSGRRDVLRQAYLAAVGFREFRGELPVLTGETVLEMATLHGAKALGLENEIGSIEVGKRADLVVHSLDRPEAYPRFRDPVDNLIYFRASSTVDTVYVDGEAILDRGRFTRFDAAEAYRRIEAAAAQFEAGVGPSTYAVWPLIE
ncbi:MAG: amidohydrolase family protein [bacterium]|nr:amidohydrolase family protein [bacterium]MDE0288213.1 amidohydrolase family protein [bacterium]MDE0439977.1 amidohydrolase family protein [bacterium]